MARGFVDSQGRKVPSISNVLDVLAKPALVGWANKIGRQGLTIAQYTDPLKAVGTLTHALIAEDLGGVKVDMGRHAPDVRAQAEHCFAKYAAWKAKHTVEPISVETDLVSAELRYGGRPDAIVKVDGAVEVLSIKTAKAIYDEAYIQVAAERNLAVEHHFSAERTRILQIGRNEEEGFGETVLPGPGLLPYFRIFGAALTIYTQQQLIKAGVA